MTNEEAEKMLVELSKHFREPVMPVSRYCKALETWASAISARASRLMEKLYPGIGAGDKAASALFDAERPVDPVEAAYKARQRPTERDRDRETLHGYIESADRIRHVFLQIGKSNLLWRLIYGGQELRTTPCPVHEGRWSGCKWPNDPKDACPCMDGCNVTGWLPNKPDTKEGSA